MSFDLRKLKLFGSCPLGPECGTSLQQGRRVVHLQWNVLESTVFLSYPTPVLSSIDREGGCPVHRLLEHPV